MAAITFGWSAFGDVVCGTGVSNARSLFPLFKHGKADYTHIGQFTVNNPCDLYAAHVGQAYMHGSTSARSLCTLTEHVKIASDITRGFGLAYFLADIGSCEASDQ